MSQEGRLYVDSIPSRWLKCPPKSYELLINKFIVFKTPLNQRYDDQVKDDIFQVQLVFQSMKNKHRKLGLWIDLTNTTRYYDREEVELHDCKYVKLPCEGHKGTPSVSQTNSFITLCDDFIRQFPLEVIGVHCTHGFNRSGFLLVSYLVQNLDWELGAAISEFAKIRPPGIYKKNYIMELYKRYDEVEYAPAAPPLPDWCFESKKTSLNTFLETDDFDNQEYSGHQAKKARKHIKQNPEFMEGISGVEPVAWSLMEVIQNEIQEICEWKRSGFPGCQPVSLSSTNIALLSKRPYSVSWKADGVRYLMYIRDKSEVYCIDRDNSVFQVKNLTFPYRKNLHQHIKKTLLDGEMVIDKVDGISIPRYLVYDAVHMINHSIKNYPFQPIRYEAIAREIIEPRIEAMKKGLINKMSEPFSIRRKEFWDIKDAAKLLTESFQKSLSHSPDGLIFQPSDDKYIPGQCENVLKWKPLSLNSVDFRLKIVTESGEGILTKKVGELYVGNKKSRYGYLSSIKNVKNLDSKIIECRYENGKWIFMRERTDKSFPNSFETAESVLESIRTPITEETLLRYIENNRYGKNETLM